MKKISYSGKAFFVVFFLLAACSFPLPETKAPLPEQSRIVITETLRPSATATSIPLTATPTQTDTPNPTWTPLPTLAEHEAYDLVDDLIYNNPDCRLPCWFGITPGETTWADAMHFFAAFGTNKNQQPVTTNRRIIDGRLHTENIYHVFYPIDEENTGAAGFGVVDNEMISIIGMGKLRLEHSIQLPQFLEDYGPPTQVYLDTADDVPSSNFPFVIALIYEEQHIMVVYDYGNAARTDGVIRSCPEPVGISLFLWAEGAKIEMEDIELRTVGADPSEPLRQLEDVTDFTIDSFYNTFKEPGNTACIETPVEYWE